MTSSPQHNQISHYHRSTLKIWPSQAHCQSEGYLLELLPRPKENQTPQGVHDFNQSNVAKLEFLCTFSCLPILYLNWPSFRVIQSDPPELEFMNIYNSLLTSPRKICLKPELKETDLSFVYFTLVWQPCSKFFSLQKRK